MEYATNADINTGRAFVGDRPIMISPIAPIQGEWVQLLAGLQLSYRLKLNPMEFEERSD
jgi:hypothetical protein